MSDWICTNPSEREWQRRLDDGRYEMVSVAYIGYLDECRYSAAHGTFSLDVYADDFEYIFDTFIEDGQDMTDDCLAMHVFECNICDFELESFDTEGEAVAWVNGFMEG